MAIRPPTRRTLRLISLVAVQILFFYFRPHYRTILQCLLAVGALCAAVALVIAVFPYEKQPTQDTARPAQ